MQYTRQVKIFKRTENHTLGSTTGAWGAGTGAGRTGAGVVTGAEGAGTGAATTGKTGAAGAGGWTTGGWTTGACAGGNTAGVWTAGAAGCSLGTVGRLLAGGWTLGATPETSDGDRAGALGSTGVSCSLTAELSMLLDDEVESFLAKLQSHMRYIVTCA